MNEPSTERRHHGATLEKSVATGPGIAPQTLTVYDGDGTDLGTVNTNVNVQDLLGIDST